jgi:hypothetical protein
MSHRPWRQPIPQSSGPDAHVAMLVVQRHLLQGLLLGFAQLYNTLHLDSGAMGSPKLTKFKRVYQQHLKTRLGLAFGTFFNQRGRANFDAVIFVEFHHWKKLLRN